MDEVFRDMHQRFVIYIVEILIYSWNLAEHRHHVAQVLQCLRHFILYLKLEKCEFYLSTSWVTSSTDAAFRCTREKYNSTTQDWPQPSSIKELQLFIGFGNF